MTETKDTQFDALFNAILDIMPRHDEDFADHAEWFAKELFDRGVVVLPCKVGDTVYQIDYNGYVVEREVMHFIVQNDCIKFAFYIPDFGEYITAKDEKVFLTREEAEAALKRRADDG